MPDSVWYIGMVILVAIIGSMVAAYAGLIEPFAIRAPESGCASCSGAT